ncbi:MAG: hypothetical protein ACHQRM_05900 [Bacteroidia bacterium]
MMTKPKQVQIRQELFSLCEQMLLQRIETSSLAMKSAQESANSDDKSSAGDKYETGRAVGQRETEMHAVNLKQYQQDLAFFRTIDPDIIHTQAGLGAVVQCKDFHFFISLGLGAAQHAIGKVYMLSTQAPLAAALKGKKAGESFLMNGKQLEIVEVF